MHMVYVCIESVPLTDTEYHHVIVYLGIQREGGTKRD